MRYSSLFGKTVRDKPRNAVSRSHELLLRAGFIRPAPGGGFLLLPLGERVAERIEGVLARELERLGGQMLGLPGGRQSANSDTARSLRLHRRESGFDYPFAEQHETALAMLAGGLSLSYRELPLVVAGRQWGSREEARANQGLLRAAEFLFHSAYAFGAPAPRLGDAFEKALERAGVAALPLASAGTTEYVIRTELPGRELLECEACGYRADVETAESRAPEWPQTEQPGVKEAIYGPGFIQVEPLAKFLGIPVHQTTKTLLFATGGRLVAACVPGIYDVSETKLARVLHCRELELAPAETVRELTRSEVGYAGPAGLPDSVEVVWDLSTERRTNFEAGANRTDHHMINLNFGRDVARPERFFDIRVAREGERCARCPEGTLVARRAVALGHVTELGDLYADLLGARFLDKDKATRPLAMAAAGLDVTAALAAVVEANSDGRGIVWPSAVAPFDAHLVSLPPAEEAAEALYRRLTDSGVAAMWDDRPESAGVKFGDADLVGIPVRLVLSKRTGDRIEWKQRSAEQGELLTGDEAIARLKGEG